MTKHGYRVMDSDIHIIEPDDLWQRYVEPKYRDQAPKYPPATSEASLVSMVVAGRQIPPPLHGQSAVNRGLLLQRDKGNPRYAPERARHYDNVSLLQGMDNEGIDVAVAFPTKGLLPLATNALAPDLALAIARGYNNWLAEFASLDPSRIIGAGMTPPHEIGVAVQEARRAVKELGFRGIFLRPNLVHGRNWHDPYYDPLWAELEDLDVPLCFHESRAPDLPFTGDRFENAMMQHIAEHPMEQMLAMISMIVGGVLERFKRLRIAFLEGNCSWLQHLLWRMDEHAEYRARFEAPYLTKTPTDYFREGRCYMWVECDEEPAVDTIRRFGDEAFVYSSDYPHNDAKYPHATEAFLSLKIPETARRNILWDNCRRLYGLQ